VGSAGAVTEVTSRELARVRMPAGGAGSECGGAGAAGATAASVFEEFSC
jgi:hypothetical protein